jgi:hypothetical protein
VKQSYWWWLLQSPHDKGGESRLALPHIAGRHFVRLAAHVPRSQYLLEKHHDFGYSPFLTALGSFLSYKLTRPRTPTYPADWPTPTIMLSLVLMILFVHIAIYLVNTIGASTIDLLVSLLISQGFYPFLSKIAP